MSAIAEPIICFGIRTKAPYYIYNTLPNRLARVRHVQFDYIMDTPKPHNTHCKISNPYAVRCPDCNLWNWFRLVAKYMTGLRILDIFMRLKTLNDRLPSFEDTWVAALLHLQAKSKSVRKFDLIVVGSKQILQNPANRSEIRKCQMLKSRLIGRLAEIKQSRTVTDERLEV